MAKTQEMTKSKPQNFEEILECLGGFGKFQVLVLALLLFMEIPAAFVGLVPVFVGRMPDLNLWTCNGEHLTETELCNCNGTLSAPSTSIVSEWLLVCDSAWVSDFVTSLQMFGILFGNIYTSQLADWYGRRYTFLGTSLLLLTGTIVSAVAPNPYVYGFARFLCGTGFSGNLALAAIYTIEFQPANWRQLGGSVGPFGEGTILFALIAYFVRPWRTLLWISTTPFLCLLIIFPLLPESPRWLLRNRKVEEAHKVISYMARLNGAEPIDLDVLEEIANKENPIKNTVNEENGKQKVQRFTYLDFFRYKELRRTTICLIFIWSSWSVSYFGLTYNIKNLPGNIYINVAYLGLADALGFPSFLFTANKLGRRRSLVLFSSIGSMFLVTIAVLFLTVDTTDYPAVIVLLTMLAKYGTAGARSAARCLTGESFPTSIRSMGAEISGAVSGFTAFLAPQLVFLGTHWPSVPFFGFAAISVCGSLFAFLMKETTGKPLNDEIIRRKSISISVVVPKKEVEDNITNCA